MIRDLTKAEMERRVKVKHEIATLLNLIFDDDCVDIDCMKCPLEPLCRSIGPYA